MLKKLAMLSACAASAFALHTAEMNINNKDLEVGAQFDIGQFSNNIEPNTLFIGAKYLGGDPEHSEDENISIDPLLEANLLMMKEVGNSGFKLGMGVKFEFTKNYAALPLGVEGSYTINTKEFVPMHLNASVYYAPEVLAMRDADSYMEARVSFDIELIQNGNVTVGYRNIETDYLNNEDRTYNRSAYLGFKLKF